MAQPPRSKSSLSLNQSRSYANTMRIVVGDVFRSNKPADRVLSAFFKANKQLGSKDRRAVMETLFSVFRWWGWLQQMGVSTEALVKKEVTNKAWARVLFAAHALDNDDFAPYAVAWKETAGIKKDIPPMGSLSLQEKSAAMATWFIIPDASEAVLIPSWVAEQSTFENDADLSRLIQSFCTRPPMWIRIQRDDIAKVKENLVSEGLTLTPIEGLPATVNLGTPKTNLYLLDSFRKGTFEVQDLASQFIGLTCAPEPGQRWWDACTGAGGKALQLASLMQNKGTIVASDIREYKLKDLKKRARRAGFSNISPRPWLQNKIPVKPESFDGILVDAPCSCSGTWRRNPDARWTTKPDDSAELAPIQLDILKRTSKGLRPGGVMIYATCSFCEQENSGVVNAFLEANPQYSLEPFPHPVTGEMTNGMLQTFPWEYDSDAMFVARMRHDGSIVEKPQPTTL